MMVKVCGITRRSDAEAAVEAGASALGFVFVPQSPRYIDPEVAAALGLGLDVWKVGVFTEETPAAVEAIMRAAKLDVAQIYSGHMPAVDRVWRAIRVTNGIDLAPAEGAEAVLLDGAKNGVGFDWARVKEVPGKVIVAGGLNPSNVAEAVRVARPWGVDASSGLESAPGIKDHEKVRRFIQAARDAAREAM